MNDENLLINSISSNKRSLTEHFVDYVKKSKCISSKDSSSRGMQREKKIIFTDNDNNQLFCSFVPGSLCIAYSISSDDHTKTSILTLHGKNFV